MEQLYQQISERCEKMKQVTKSSLTPQKFRILKDEQRLRCEKQNFIISMMRANKSTHIISKNIYYKFSYEIMKKINPEYRYDSNLEKLEQTFLNDFVGLYRHFFIKYEEMFNFKLKIQNLIRPTNHNLVIDLVKYLLDFSRDYYQQTLFWFMKSFPKIDRIQQEDSKDLEESEDDKKNVEVVKKLTRSSLNELSMQRSISKKIEEVQCSKRDPIKNYQLLDLNGWPALTTQTKDASTNIEVLKIRSNDLYRQMKSRNNLTKTNIQNYYSKYFSEKTDLKPREYIEHEDESMNRATHPFRVTLIIEKNGFNYVNIVYSDSRYYTKNKEKKLSLLKISQRLIPIIDIKTKPEYWLTSLKIIRISQNFLPPIISQNSSLINPPNSTATNFNLFENHSRINLVSSNSAANEEQVERKLKKQNQYQATQSNLKEEKISNQKSFRKLSQLKRGFRSQQKREAITAIGNTCQNDPQKKIYDWLEKLKQIKEIERRKIMGLK